MFTVKFDGYGSADNETVDVFKKRYRPSPAPVPALSNSKTTRSTTGYLLFCKHKRQSIIDAFPSLTPQKILTELARQWKALPPPSQAAWSQAAATNTAPPSIDLGGPNRASAAPKPLSPGVQEPPGGLAKHLGAETLEESPGGPLPFTP